ncbi:hypothetical protein CYLTODRAFT_230303 [Cylindrobasidium torrendii FP15055 ss-10]|uniref:BHLH domain-containing protein n=1 Tax=Cylindrobasidium torrendii FP15055 ss-10 TaxID=1314674 RepID=A0A0D7BFU0_9AGAR|nr:hypothetical protein CYLTODRAFT_230303 [Cylindrobasidium torrendii FP15055 ss-10]
MDHNMSESGYHHGGYYSGGDEHQQGGYPMGGYAPSEMGAYQVGAGPTPQTRACIAVASLIGSDNIGAGIEQQLQAAQPSYGGLYPGYHHQQAAVPVYGTQLATNTPPPASPEIYGEPMSPPISGSDTSADGLYQHSHSSSGANSPSSSRSHSLVHRTSTNVRYNPTTPSPTTSSGGRGRRQRSQDSDDDDMGVLFSENLAHSRKEATRRQRIEAEQRRRDELRDGYAKLKDVLPVSNQKSSKVSLLDRATSHIISLEAQNTDLQKRVQQMEAELHRLRSINEKIALGEDPATYPVNSRPMSPPPDHRPGHSHASAHSPSPAPSDY